MAEVGMGVAAKRKCQECGADIPRWTGVGKKRRQVRKDAQFCSGRCARKASRASSAKTPAVIAIEDQNPLCRNGSLEDSLDVSPAAEARE